MCFHIWTVQNASLILSPAPTYPLPLHPVSTYPFPVHHSADAESVFFFFFTHEQIVAYILAPLFFSPQMVVYYAQCYAPCFFLYSLILETFSYPYTKSKFISNLISLLLIEIWVDINLKKTTKEAVTNTFVHMSSCKCKEYIY